MDAAPDVEGSLSSEMEDMVSFTAAEIIHVVGIRMNGDCLCCVLIEKTCPHHVKKVFLRHLRKRYFA